MASTKSRVALEFSVRDFVLTHKEVFMWTFTFSARTGSDVAGALWNAFWQGVRNNFGKFHSLKVVEMHPGGHGVHFHVLVSCYLPMWRLREIGAPHGFGFMWAKRVKSYKNPSSDAARANAERVGRYVAKYFTKSAPADWKGARMWSRLGGFVGSKVKDIVINCVVTRCLAVVRVGLGLRQLPYAKACLIAKLASVWGDYAEWPCRYQHLIGFLPPRLERLTEVSNYDVYA